MIAGFQIVFVLALAGFARATGVAADKCRMGSESLYPPPANTTLKWVTIDMDKAPADRWTEVVTPLAKQIEAMIMGVVDLLPVKLRTEIMTLLDAHADSICSAFPKPYGDEIAGIAKATGIDLGLLLLFNIAYELEGVCTSIVAQDQNGEIYHARNLDFGLFFGWDKANSTWRLAEMLRPLLFNAVFVSGGQELYRATVFGGYVGLLTGMKKGAFSISVDTRFDSNLDRGLIQWLRGNHSAHFLTFTTRNAIENAATYDEAFAILNNTVLIGPGYIILGGSKAGEGVVLSREEALSIKPHTLQSRIQNGSFYVLETNYDWWVQPPFFDNRRDPAEACMDHRVTSANVGFESLFNVLSAKPNLNLLTTYTTLMHVSSGAFEAYVQDCKWPCPMW